jgi:hypothetical protein
VVGWLLNWGFYGALSAQVCEYSCLASSSGSKPCQVLYYIAFPGDRTHTKCLVYAVYLIETIQTILLLHDGYVLYSARSTGVNTNVLDGLLQYLSERVAPFAGGVGEFRSFPMIPFNLLCWSSQFYGANLLCASPQRSCRLYTCLPLYCSGICICFPILSNQLVHVCADEPRTVCIANFDQL